MKRTIRGRLIGLCVPPVLLSLVDGGLTLAGQSADYWDGYYGAVNEMSPTFNHLLAHHPLAYVAGFAGWVVMFVCLILLLPQTLALTASIAIAMAHTAGASTWLLFRFNYGYGYQACCGLFLFTALALAVGIRHGWRAEAPDDAPLGARWPMVVRWGAVVAIFAITTYLFLWPRMA
jgi:hypothetical protein